MEKKTGMDLIHAIFNVPKDHQLTGEIIGKIIWDSRLNAGKKARTKIVFIKNYNNPEFRKNWNKPLPKDQEKWECLVVKDVNENSLSSGTLLVFPINNLTAEEKKKEKAERIRLRPITQHLPEDISFSYLEKVMDFAESVKEFKGLRKVKKDLEKIAKDKDQWQPAPFFKTHGIFPPESKDSFGITSKDPKVWEPILKATISWLERAKNTANFNHRGDRDFQCQCGASTKISKTDLKAYKNFEVIPLTCDHCGGNSSAKKTKTLQAETSVMTGMVMVQFSFNKKKLVPPFFLYRKRENIEDRKERKAYENGETIIEPTYNCDLNSLADDLKENFTLVDAGCYPRAQPNSPDHSYWMIRFAFAPTIGSKEMEDANEYWTELKNLCKNVTWRVRGYRNPSVDGPEHMLSINLEGRTPLTETDGTPRLLWRKDENKNKIGNKPIPAQPDYSLTII